MLVLVLAVGLGVFDLIALAQIVIRAGYSPRWMVVPVLPVVLAIATWIGLLQANANLTAGHVDASSLTHNGDAVAVLWSLTLVTTFCTWLLFVVFAFSEWPIERQLSFDKDEKPDKDEELDKEEDEEEKPTLVLAGAAHRSRRSRSHGRGRSPLPTADLDVRVDGALDVDAPIDTAEPAASAIDTAEPAASAIDTAEPAASAIDTSEPAASAIDTAEPAASAIDTAEPAASAIDTSEPAASAIDTSEPAASPVGVRPRPRKRGGGAAARRGKHVARPDREVVAPEPERPREPGWYPIEGRANEQRYWDGQAYTVSRRWSGAHWAETPIE